MEGTRSLYLLYMKRPVRMTCRWSRSYMFPASIHQASITIYACWQFFTPSRVLSELKQHFVILPRFSGVWEQKKRIRLLEMVEITLHRGRGSAPFEKPKEEKRHGEDGSAYRRFKVRRFFSQ